ncbi:MAG: hypothetical protein EPO55_00690 [Reyranella sp.]|uniref:hypothetical protein n=1 Tax=Reyranella sp. TaxID=1929291 RepID=UPI00120E4389|nr:hypothetical protein [Reyranella sp.]TAJ42778.1 MAG: hypothetical protein EPO55_00690 [Reyranella sp.]
MTNVSPLALKPFGRNATTRTRWMPQIPGELKAAFADLARELRVVARGRAEGADNRPHTSDSVPDDVQRSIWNRVGEGANMLRQFLADQIGRAEEMARGLMPEALRLEAAEADARSAIADTQIRHRETLIALRLDERKRQRDLRRFRRDNGLSRDAAYAEDRWRAAFWLLAILIGESVMNGMLFQKVSPWGLVGGVALAGFISLINVGCGYATGFVGIRLIRHVHVGLRVAGAAVALAGLAAGLAWNSLIARFRDLVEAHPELDTIDLLKSASAMDWAAFSTLEAWGLLLLGILIWAFAMLKGAGGHGCFADPYWDHANQHGAWRAADHALEDGKSAYRADVLSAIDSARRGVEVRLFATRRAAADMQSLLGHAEQRAGEVSDSLGEWVAAGVGLIKLYQEENVAIRHTPAPAYFDQVPTAEDVVPEMPSLDALRALAAEAERRAAANEQVWADYQDRLTALTREELETFLSRIADIESAADRRLTEEWGYDGAEAPSAPTQDLVAPRLVASTGSHP